MQVKILVFALFLLSLAMIQCSQDFAEPMATTNGQVNNPPHTINLFYTNSFETAADTIGWAGNGGIEIRADAPPGGGHRSLFVSGGCFTPHFFVEFDNPLNVDCNVKLRCWGKNLEIGGAAELSRTDDPEQFTFVVVDNPNWTPYETATFFFPAGQKLRLSLNSGGFAYSAMLIDRIEVFRVE